MHSLKKKNTAMSGADEKASMKQKINMEILNKRALAETGNQPRLSWRVKNVSTARNPSSRETRWPIIWATVLWRIIGDTLPPDKHEYNYDSCFSHGHAEPDHWLNQRQQHIHGNSGKHYNPEKVKHTDFDPVYLGHASTTSLRHLIQLYWIFLNASFHMHQELTWSAHWLTRHRREVAARL